jgi:hypothetical protein
VLAGDDGGVHPGGSTARHRTKHQRASKGVKPPVHGRLLNENVSVLIMFVS